MTTYICTCCKKEQSVYNFFCEECNYSQVFRRKLSELEQEAIVETLEVLNHQEKPFLVTREENLLGFHKLYKKTLHLMAVLDDEPRDEIEASLDEFDNNYPELKQMKRNAELILVGTLMEQAYDIGANALCNLHFILKLNSDKKMCLLCKAVGFQVSPIEQVETLTDEKFQELYEQVEREYKNHRFRQNYSYSMNVYNMAMRLVSGLDVEKEKIDIIRLVSLFYGIEDNAFKYLSYYGDPDFESAKEYLLHHGVPSGLCQQVEQYLRMIKEYKYYDFERLDKIEKLPDKEYVQTLEWKLLRDTVKLCSLGLQSVASVMHDGGIIYDPDFFWFGDLDECPFSASSIDIIWDEAVQEHEFYLEESKKIAQKRCDNMKHFVKVFKMEAKAEDEVE